MILRTSWFFLCCIILLGAQSCGIFSLTGANIQGNTCNVHFIENATASVAPRLSGILTDKIRNKILNQTTLANNTGDNADYDISGQITAYNIGVAAVSTADVSTQNRLTITVEIQFENMLDSKNNWIQSFSKFADYPSSQNIQSVELQLMEEISTDLADQIFTKAFVNW